MLLSCADSYAATFISLASHYLVMTGDRDFIERNLDDLGLVASVLIALQDTDGLTFVSPGNNTKYLMDNCEVSSGLNDWANAHRIWDRFNEQFPVWCEGGVTDGFPWAKIAISSVKMGDGDRASAFAWVAQEYGLKARPYPSYVLESAHLFDLYVELYPVKATGPGIGGHGTPQPSEAS